MLKARSYFSLFHTESAAVHDVSCVRLDETLYMNILGQSLESVRVGLKHHLM